MDRVALPSRPHENRLFAALSPAEAARLQPALEPVTWALRDVCRCRMRCRSSCIFRRAA
jgi:hypothetical protein